jgi:transposase
MHQDQGGWLVFLDETGLLLTPLTRATWAPRGFTPKLEQTMRHRKKISVIAALCVHADGRRVRLYLSFFFEDGIDADMMQHFLGDLLHHLDGPVTLLWDQLGAHQCEEVEDFLNQHPRVKTYEFPPYCPELNPVEYLWRWLKWDMLANFAPVNLQELDENAGKYCAQACEDKDLLRSFIAQSELPLDLKWVDRALVT